MLKTWRDAGSFEKAQVSDVEKNRVSKQVDKLKKQDLTDAELAMLSRTGDRDNKMAALNILMSKNKLEEGFKSAGFTDPKDSNKVNQNVLQQAVQDSLKSFSELGVKNQKDYIRENYAHLLYNLKSLTGKADFEKDVKANKIDYSKQQNDFFASDEVRKN
jgi:hypothetical protein